jgi:hypothetical protein
MESVPIGRGIINENNDIVLSNEDIEIPRIFEDINLMQACNVPLPDSDLEDFKINNNYNLFDRQTSGFFG